MAKDPYRYFRIEARELLDGLSQGVLELEKGGAVKEVTNRLLRFAHTLKGAARVVKLVSVAELAHAVEDVLEPYREGHRPIPRQELTGLLRLVDSMSARLASIDETTDALAPTRAHAGKDELADTVRVEIAEVDRLLEGVSETLIHVNVLEREGAALGHVQELMRSLVTQLRSHGPRDGEGLRQVISEQKLARVSSSAEEILSSLDRHAQHVSGVVEQVATELLQVRDAANRMRLAPASSMFGSLELAVRDATEVFARRVEFSASGGDHRLDAHVLFAVRDALLHTVRNAVAHGIETADVRVAANKPPSGHIDISVQRRGSRIAFTCADDGGGFDVNGLRDAAVQRGLLSSSEAGSLSIDGLIELVLKGGLTTANALTEVSGRAVGLDMVRDTAARLRGDVSLRTEVGRGTRVEICVPLSLSSMAALVVEASGIAASVPLESIRRTLRVRDSDMVRSADGESIHYEDRLIPFLSLAEALQPELPSCHRPKQWSVLVIEVGDAVAAIGVERLLETTTIVMKPLPAYADVDAIVAGVSLNSDGQPQIVIDPVAIVAASRGSRRRAIEGELRTRHPILVVDDSLTTRMLEQSILESAGYEVELATSAEEALHKAHERPYCLFVVDVEMPGMDGFEFVTKTREDAALREIPAILVTSRNSTDDVRRGREVGAHAHIVKGEFDQNYLLQTIRELVG